MAARRNAMLVYMLIVASFHLLCPQPTYARTVPDNEKAEMLSKIIDVVKEEEERQARDEIISPAAKAVLDKAELLSDSIDGAVKYDNGERQARDDFQFQDDNNVGGEPEQDIISPAAASVLERAGELSGKIDSAIQEERELHAHRRSLEDNRHKRTLGFFDIVSNLIGGLLR